VTLLMDEGGRDKQAVVSAIAALVGAPPPPVAHGSREPKSILIMVNERLGLGLDNSMAKPDLAEAICQAGGVVWTPACWSRPQTLTREGLVRVEAAVRNLLAPL
jgi:hypothetical protein